jgi:hypothetical protein
VGLQRAVSQHGRVNWTLLDGTGVSEIAQIKWND